MRMTSMGSPGRVLGCMVALFGACKGAEGTTTGDPDSTATGDDSTTGAADSTTGDAPTGGDETGDETGDDATSGDTSTGTGPEPTGGDDTTSATTGEQPEGGAWDHVHAEPTVCGVDVDGAGNVYVLDSTARVDKLGLDGELLWTRDFGCYAAVSLGQQDPCYIDVNAAGEIAIAGLFSGPCTIGDEVFPHDADWMDVYVARLDPSGAPLWARSFGANDGEIQVADGVAIDGQGDVTVLLSYDNAIDVGAGVWIADGDSGDPDIALAKYAGSDGAYQWGKQWKGDVVDEGLALAVNPGGDLLVVGSLSKGILDTDRFIASFAPDGTLTWERLLLDTDVDIFAAEIDADGRALIGASFYSGTIDFGNGPVSDEGDGVTLFAIYDDGGAASQVTAIGPILDATEVRFVPGGRVAIAGAYYGSPVVAGEPLPEAPFDRLFVVVSDEPGEHIWSGSYGDDAEFFASEYVTGLAVDGPRLVIAGEFEESIDFGFGKRTPVPGNSSSSFVAVLKPEL